MSSSEAPSEASPISWKCSDEFILKVMHTNQRTHSTLQPVSLLLHHLLIVKFILFVRKLIFESPSQLDSHVQPTLSPTTKIVTQSSFNWMSKCNFWPFWVPFRIVTCENWANSLSASMGICPSSSWQQSLSEKSRVSTRTSSWTHEWMSSVSIRRTTHGSGECIGAEEWRMYCVHWNTLKAKLLRKSLADSRPATGRSWKPVLSEKRAQNTVRHTKERAKSNWVHLLKYCTPSKLLGWIN